MNSDANVDLTEIAKFEAIASRWWDMEGEFKPLHQINPVRLDWITDKSGGLFGKRVIDIGCGGGILSESMARRGARVTGIDFTPEIAPRRPGDPMRSARPNRSEREGRRTSVHATGFQVSNSSPTRKSRPYPRSVSGLSAERQIMTVPLRSSNRISDR